MNSTQLFYLLIVVLLLVSNTSQNSYILLELLQKRLDRSNDALSTEREAFDAVTAWFAANQMSTRQKQYANVLVHADFACDVAL